MNILSGTFHTVKNAVNPPKYHYFASLKLKIFTHELSREKYSFLYLVSEYFQGDPV
jgi:hypothetical protein